MVFFIEWLGLALQHRLLILVACEIDTDGVFVDQWTAIEKRC